MTYASDNDKNDQTLDARKARGKNRCFKITRKHFNQYLNEKKERIMDEEIRKIVNTIKDQLKENILIRYHNEKYWDVGIISLSIAGNHLVEWEKLEIVKEIYSYGETDTASDLPDWMLDEFDLHEFDETEGKYICKCCGQSEKAYRMFDIDGTNLEESLVCLNCGDGTLQYKNLKY